jgi:sorbitol-6-phosphate 2-dehydrogenase
MNDMQDWLGLKGKVAVVTGGAAGIGRVCCEALAEVGAKVVIADVNKDGGLELVKDLKQRYGAESIFANTDVSSKTSVDGMVAAALAAFGTVDVLVNNAGILIPRLLVDPAGKEELTEAILDKMVAINFKGMFLCAQAAARHMLKAGGGVIINMSSESGLEGSEGQSVYASTKAAAYNMTRSWAKELGKQGIRVVGIAPGILEVTALRTEAYEKALAYTRGIGVEQLRAKYEDVSIPLGRVGKLREIADTVCFLASARAGYIHGTTVNVSGGKSRG